MVSFPGPGWRFASPRTAITFRRARIEALAGLRVTGSRSGEHTGRLHALRVGSGAIFTPDAPFRPGEQVTVRTGLPVHGARGPSFTFTTARSGRTPSAARAAARGDDPGARTASAVGPCTLRRRRLRTLPGLHPAAMCTAGRRAGKGSGRVFITPRPLDRGPGAEWGAAILSRNGKLLWYSRSSSKVNDLKPVELAGRRVLALFHRTSARASYYELLDQRYRPVGRVVAGNGYGVDSHELQVGPRGTAYLGAYKAVWVGDDRKITDYVVQEVDPATGDVLFEWHALDQVPPSASYRLRPDRRVAWDFFHGNAIEPPTRRGRTLLVSSRNTSAVYGVDRLTGRVRWVLGGKRDGFGIVARHPQWQFCAQHDVRRLSNGDVSVFDNGGTRLRSSTACPLHPARVLRFRLDVERGRARLVRSVSSLPSSDTGSGHFPYAVGSARRLPRCGSMLVDWGTVGRITEVTRGGRVPFRLALENWTYRAVEARWTGRPPGRPAVAVRRRDARTLDVWASWNGATEIRRWRVLAGGSPERLAAVGEEVPFADLETRMRVPVPRGYVAVQALGATGTVLGQSEAVATG